MVDVSSLVGSAANIRTGENPAFALSDFLSIYPQFGENSQNEPIVDPDILQMYIDFSNTCIKEARWHSAWKIAMGLFVAHFATLYLQSMANPESGAAAVVAAGQARGLMVSKAVGDVSVNYDFSTIAQDLEGWAAWKLTTFGQQLATMGKLVGMGGMYVY